MRGRLRTIATCLAAFGCLLSPASAGAADEFEKYDIDSAAAELSTTQAGAHPDFTASLLLAEKEGVPYGLTRDVIVALPPGLFGNPGAFPECSGLEFGTDVFASACPQDSQVGAIDVAVGGSISGTFFDSPIYNMPAPGGDVVARFGFYAAQYPAFINVRLDPETHNLVAAVENSPSGAVLIEAVSTFWGVPADPIHDPERLTPAEEIGRAHV